MSILLHVTPRRNLPSIFRIGLLPAFSQGARQEIWLCSRSRRRWAMEHVAERHGVPVSEVIVLRVSVPRPRLVRRASGLWTCARAIKSLISVSLPFAA